MSDKIFREILDSRTMNNNNTNNHNHAGIAIENLEDYVVNGSISHAQICT